MRINVKQRKEKNFMLNCNITSKVRYCPRGT